MKASKSLLIAAASGVALWLCVRKVKGVGKLSDNPLDLNNILMGIDRGWYTARPDILNGMYVVYLAGKKTDGEFTEDVYPISKQTYDALVAQGVGGFKTELAIKRFKELGLFDYVLSEIPAHEAGDAIRRMYVRREPLYRIDPELYRTVNDLVEAWCNENEVSPDEVWSVLDTDDIILNI